MQILLRRTDSTNGSGDDVKEDNDLCRVVTLSEACDDPKKVEFTVENLKPSEGGGRKWAEYVKGVVANFHGPLKGCGFDAVIATSVPIGKSYDGEFLYYFWTTLRNL